MLTRCRRRRKSKSVSRQACAARQMVAEAEEFVPDKYDGGDPTITPMATGIDQCTYGNSAGVQAASK